jgi:hypothetical protein
MNPPKRGGKGSILDLVRRSPSRPTADFRKTRLPSLRDWGLIPTDFGRCDTVRRYAKALGRWPFAPLAIETRGE